MDVIVLAAGRGERLRPLTDRTPKPLLEIGGRTLIDRHLAALAEGGFSRVVVNVSHLGGHIMRHLGDGSRHGLEIVFSVEPDGPLEVGGGILRALGLIRGDPFLAVNADILTDFPFARLAGRRPLSAHVVLVANPAHHRRGDFVLHGDRVGNLDLAETDAQTLTFSGISVLRRRLFDGCVPGRLPLAPLLRAAAGRGQVSGERWDGAWADIGTPDRLAAARRLAGH